jgi:hypothetical protein
MKKQEKRATKRDKKPLKDLPAKAASSVRGGAVSGRLKWSDIELKRGVD